MRKLIIISITLFLLSSFSVGKSQDVDNNSIVNDSLKQAYTSKLNGVWVMTNYIDDIQKNKSPLKSFRLLNGKGVVELSINGSINKDTILCSAVINNHEELNFTGYFKKSNISILRINLEDYYTDCHYEIGLDPIINKINIVLYRFNSENKLIEKRNFTKVLEQYSKKNTIERGISRVVNEAILVGQYSLVKTKEKEPFISFNSDGSITGLEQFNSYYIRTDFLIGPTQNFNQIMLERKDGKHKAYALIIHKDTVYLNQLKGNDEKFEILKLGKIKYTLIKK